ncbi:MAG TPA: DUF4127 family protein, partial [Bacilli bacterium]|nr:DUF4127 family protein [Bacilli bacterium]
LCGDLLVGANFDQMLAWLDDEITDTDYLIVAADGLCSGGLVQARLGQIDAFAVMDRLEVFSEYKKRFPHLKIYVFDTIMRTSITALNKETEKYWGKMNEYSRLLGRTYFFNDEKEKAKLQELLQEIPADMIATYTKARQVKHELNKFFLDLVNQQIVDYLLLLQEDSMPYGVQKIEQEVLQRMIKHQQLEKRVKFYNGTDEGGVVLLGKIILEIKKISPSLFVHLPHPDVLAKVMLFEDQLFSENLKQMLETMGFKTTDSWEQADFILSIYAEARNINLDTNSTIPILPTKDNQYHCYIKELNQFLHSHRPVALVDLLFPNGGSWDLLLDIDLKKLQVYSAWNTASNAMGSALCEIAAKIANPQKNNFKFRNERFLDDCLYQYIVRRTVNEKYLKKGYNVYHLGVNSDEVLSEIRMLMQQYDDWLGITNYRITLPWHRTFEAEIIIEE